MAAKKLEWCVLGLGAVGREHMGNLSNLGRHIHSVCDPRIPQGIKSDAVRPYREAGEDFWDGVEGRGLVIATPTKHHHEHAMRAIDSGALAIMVEKPLTGDPVKSKEIVDAAGTDGVRLATAYNYRFHKVTKDIYKWSQSTEGPQHIAIMAADRVVEWPRWGQDGYNASDPDGGGVVMTSLPHSLDLACSILGPVAAGTCRVQMDKIKPIKEPIPAGVIAVLDHPTRMRNSNLSPWMDRSVISVRWGDTESYSMVLCSGAGGATHFLFPRATAQEDAKESRKVMMDTFVPWAERKTDEHDGLVIGKAGEYVDTVLALCLQSNAGGHAVTVEVEG